jgi:hypothetical protein
MELRNRQSRFGSQKNAAWRNWQKCRYRRDRSYSEMLTAADIQLGALLGQGFAARLVG